MNSQRSPAVVMAQSLVPQSATVQSNKTLPEYLVRAKNYSRYRTDKENNRLPAAYGQCQHSIIYIYARARPGTLQSRGAGHPSQWRLS